jgi:cobalt-zinc-cadmium efflux system protein
MSHSDCCPGHDHAPGLMHVHGSTHGPLLIVSLAVTGTFVVGEAIAGYLAHSLALVSDAGHNLSDALALGLAAYAIWISKRPADKEKTYGYHRANILTALFNASSLIAIGVAILIEAISVFRNPAPINGPVMAWVAAVSVLMNTVVAWMLSGGAKTSLNMRAAYIHMVGDATSAAAVLVAGLIVRQTGWVYADPIVSVLIALFILYTAWGIVKEATNILLEASPSGLDFDRMVQTMRDVPGVQSVHDVHAWTVSDGMHYLSCHVELAEHSRIEECTRVIKDLNALLAHDFNIAHATIQTEEAGTCVHQVLDSPVFCDQSSLLPSP